MLVRFLCLGLLLNCGVALLAQEVRGSINGTVIDPSGAAVSGAHIRITNMNTSVSVETTTNDHGFYQVSFLLPGNYSVSAECSGFNKIDHQGIRVDASAYATVNLSLTVGSTSATVTVTGESPLLNTTSADLGLVVPQKVITDVGASIYRNAANFVRLAPGVTGQSEGTYTSDNQTAISINGGGGVQGGNEWILDGIPDTVPLSTGSVVVVPPVDSVEEMKVNTTMLDASFGHSTGGAISIVTKSGTNQLHGTAYGFGRWKALFANTWQNDANHVPKADVNYHLWGLFVGGPVFLPHLYDGRKRTFFSAAYETDDDVRDLSETTRVPTAAESAGNFSATLNQKGGPLTLYNPYSTVLNNGTFSSRSPFLCNGNTPVTPNLTPGPSYGTQTGGTPCAIIPPALLNPTGVGVLATLLQESRGPNIAGAADQLGTNNWFGDKTYSVGQKDLLARVDHTISEKQHLFVQLNKLTRDQSAEVLIFGTQQFNGSGSNLDTYLQYRYAATVNDTYAFTPTFVGSFSYGFVRRVNNDSYGAYGHASPTSWQLPSVITSNQYILGWPNFAIDSADTGVSLGSRINLIANNQSAVFTTFTKTFGTHTVKFGSDFRVAQYNTSSQAVPAAGQFNISALFTDSNPLVSSSSQTSGSGTASLLLGMADSGSFAAAASLALQNSYLGLFLQDSWRLNPKLTVTLGLRYDLEKPYTERHNQVAFGFNPTAPLALTVPGYNLQGGIQFAGVNGLSRREGNLDTNNFQPRLGFAYQMYPKTVVRGGYAFFYSPMADILSFLGSVPTFSPSTPYIGTNNGSATPATAISNPFPNGLVSPLGSSPGPFAQVGNSLEFLNPHRLAPYSQQWQLSIQQEFPSQMILELAYVGMLSLKELESYNLNDLPELMNLSTQNTQVTNPFYGVFASNSTLGASKTTASKNLEVAFPQFTTLTEDGVNSGTSTYNALSMRVEKRLTHGLSVIGTYNWSKLMHNNVTSLVNESFFHNNLVNYRSISQFDQPQLVRISVMYAFPTLFAGSNGSERILHPILDGWELTNYYDWESGSPLSITGTNGRPIITGNPQGQGPINKRLGNIVVNGVPQNPYFNTAAFQQLPSQYYDVTPQTPGGVSPTPPYLGTIRAPHSASLNTSVLKNFPIHEQIHVQLRLEAFNTTNHPTFNAPGTNSSSVGSFGVITGASNSRSMQVALKIIF